MLTLTSSDLATTGAFTLTMPVAATSGPASGATDVVGNVKRTGFVSGGAALSFGNPFNTIRINSGAAPADINILLAKNAPATYAAAVLRSYTITPNGANGPATLRLHYRQAELNGNSETPTVNFNLRRGPNWGPAIVPTSRNVGVAEDNWLENNAVTAFSEWTFANLAPTAAGGVVIGRIVDDRDGLPVEGAVVRLNGTQNRKFITDANGFYRFDNVETNGFYTVTPSRANYTFSPSVRSFSQIGETTEAAFGATLSSSGFDQPFRYARSTSCASTTSISSVVNRMKPASTSGAIRYSSVALTRTASSDDARTFRRLTSCRSSSSKPVDWLMDCTARATGFDLTLRSSCLTRGRLVWEWQ